jgi:hypothetical protein
MAEGSEHSGGKSLIPFFFFDVISFIVPGAILLIGGFGIWFGKEWSSVFYEWLHAPGREEGSIAAIGVILGVIFSFSLALRPLSDFFCRLFHTESTNFGSKRSRTHCLDYPSSWEEGAIATKS